MALSYKNDQDEDERLDPYSDSARNLYSQEQDAYDREFNDIADNFDSSADSDQEDKNIDAVKNIDNAKEKEEQGGGWENNVTGGSEKASGKINVLKKKGPMGLIIGLLLGGGAGLTMLFSPGILLVQLKEAMTEKFNDQLAAMDVRTTVIMKKRINNDITKGVCKPVKIRCKYKTMSTRQLKKLEKAGVKINGDKNFAGRVKVESFEFDGQKYGPSELGKAVKSDPRFRAAMMRGYNPKFAGFADSTFMKISQRLKLTKNKNISGTDREKMKEQMLDVASGDAGAKANAGVRTEEGDDGKTHYYNDATGEELTKADYDSILEKAGKLDGEIAARKALGEVGEKATKASIKGALTSTAMGLGAVDSACTGYTLIRTVGFAAKYIGALQLLRYAHTFMNTADAIKAGDAKPEEVQFMAEKLTSVNADGLSATDSYGYKYAAYGDYQGMPTNEDVSTTNGDSEGKLSDKDAEKIIKNDEVTKYINGQLVTDNILSKIIGFVDSGAGGVTDAADDTCGFVKSGWGQTILIGAAVVGAVVAFFSGGASLGWGAAAQVAVSVAMGIAIALLTPKLIDMAAGKMINGSENGNQTGNAITSGMGAYNAQTAQGRGLAVLNKDDAVAYSNLTNDIQNQYIAAENLNRSPLDPTSKHTFVGSIVSSLIPYTSKASSLSGGLLAATDVAKRSFSSIFSPVTSAATEKEQYNVCQDREYKDSNLAADPFCNLRYGMSADALQTDPDEVVDYMTPYIDEETGEPKTSDNDYANYIKNCIDRTTSIGGYSEDNDNKGDECIQGNSGSDNKKYTMFRLFYIDNSILKGMDEEQDQASAVDTFTVASYNILHAESHPGPSNQVGGCDKNPVAGDPNCAKTRSKNQASIVMGQTGNPAFDIFGTQETSRPQYDELKKLLTNYDVYPSTNARLSNSQDGAVAVWWNTEKFTKFAEGKAPNISNTAKDITNPWVGLQTNSGQKVYVMSIHYPIAQYSDPKLGDKGTLEKGAKLTIDWVKKNVSGDSPVIVVGDFNDRLPEKTTYCAFTKDGIMQHAYDMQQKLDPKKQCPTKKDIGIDHIYITPSDQVKASGWTHMSKDNSTVAHGSDHTPVYTTVTLGKDDAAGGSSTATPEACKTMSDSDLGQIACKAYQFDNYGYLWGGGHGGTASGFMSKFSSGGYKAGQESILDCSGLVRMSIYSATGVDIGGMGTGSYPGYSKFKAVSKSEAKAGDILYKPGHTEIIVSNDPSKQRFETFGAHTSNTAFEKQIGPSSYSYSSVTQIYRFQKG